MSNFLSKWGGTIALATALFALFNWGMATNPISFGLF